MRCWGLAVIVLGLMALFAPSAFGAVDVTGSWFHNEIDFSQAGAPDGGFSGVYDDFTTETTAGGFSGTESEHGDFEYGTVSGDTVSFYTQYAGGGSPFKEIYVGTLSDNDLVISGYGAQCTDGSPSTAFQTATFVMSLPQETNAPDPPRTVPAAAASLCDQTGTGGTTDPTTVSLTCARATAVTDSSMCTALVTDTAFPASTPTGSVDFSVGSGQGSLPSGSTCTLVPTSAAAASPASCSITYAPAAGGLSLTDPVPVSAQYVGDTNHQPASIDHGTSTPTSGTTTTTGTTTTGTTTTTSSTTTTTGTTRTSVTTSTTGMPGSGPAPPPVTQATCTNGPPSQDIVACGQLAANEIADGSGYGPETLPGSLAALSEGPRFIRTFPLFIDTGAGWVEVYGQVQGYLSGQGMAQSVAAHDPPAVGYTTLAKVAATRVPLARIGGSAKQRAEALLVNRWLRGVAKARGLADAFILSVNRAGGAKAAGSTKWQGAQTRHAIALAHALAAEDTALIPLTSRVAVLATRSPLARHRRSLAALGRIRAQLAHEGVTPRQRAIFTQLGDSPAEIAAIVVAARDRSLKLATLLPSPAAGLSDPRLITEESALALYFTLWPKLDSVLSAAALH